MRSVKGTGRAIFVAILLLIAGTLNIIYGISALTDANFWGAESNYVFGKLHTWGWITVIIGVIQIVGGVSLFGRGGFGRLIGIIGASLGALGSLLAVGGAYPFWALGIFAICLWCLHGLIVLGEPIEAERHSLPGSSDPGAGAPRG
jgi:hypothetical protein